MIMMSARATIERGKSWSRRATLAFLLALLSVWGIPTSSFAACTNDAGAAQNASSFLGNPSTLNGPNGPRSSAEIANDVRDFVAANPQALAAVIAILKGNRANLDQQKAIGTGLGLAADIWKRPDLNFATENQTQLAGTDSADAKAQYAAITGNNPIRSVAAGGVGGGPGSSGSVGGQTTPLGTTGSNSRFQAFTVAAPAPRAELQLPPQSFAVCAATTC